MGEVWYTEPSGNNLQNPTAERMLGFMRRGDDYWVTDSPVGVLVWHNNPTKKRATSTTAIQRHMLMFVRHPKRGWYFEYSTFNLPDERHLVPVAAGADLTRYTKHWSHGKQLHFLTCCFVAPAVAEQVVTDFLVAHEPPSALSWVPFASVQPRLDAAGYRARRRQLKDGA